MTDAASIDDLRTANRAVVEAFFAELFFVTSRMVREATFLGEPYPQSFIHVIRVRDGKVILQQEYFDSEVLAGAERAARAKGRSPLQ